MQIKYKNITVYIKNKKGQVLKSSYQKQLFTVNMFPKNKQNKLRQTKKDEIKEESHLNYTTKLKHAFCFMVCLLSYKLAKHT